MQKHLHVIGICGVATSALAIAFHKKGWKVTGSDKGFFPPISTELEKQGVEFYAGWHPENMGTPDIVMTGGAGTSPNNPEVIYAKEKNIPVFSYPEIIEQYIIKKNSIVIAGTWGKTTISSLLSFVLLKAGMAPSYFTGGLSLSHETGQLNDSEWSVVEGDEYQVSISDKRPKFVYYHPTHLLLTSVSWDHADVYPTEEAYFQVFKELVKNSQTVVACIDDAGVQKIITNAITYGVSEHADYRYHSIEHTRDGISFTIDYKGQSFALHSPMLGRFNAENIAGCFAMAHSIGIAPEKIVKAIANFQGIKRRFEKRFTNSELTILDCHAPTPDKAKSVLESIRDVYKKKIVVVFEPNIGGRERASAYKYDNAFKDADMVIIPRLTKLKVGEEMPMEGKELADTIAKTHPNVRYIENDEELVNNLKGDVIAFLGSHGFRGMIEATISLRQQSQ